MKKYRIYIEVAIILAVIALLYRSTILWLVERYTSTDSYYSHGFLVPLVTAYLIWLRRKELENIARVSSLWGLVSIAFGIGLHLVSVIAEVFFVSGFSIFFVVLGISLFLYGKEITKKIAFPLGFLFFMFPLPLVAIKNISFHLKMFVTKYSMYFMKNFTGIPIKNEGFRIFFPNASLTVGNPCSGLRSLIAMLALGSVFAYLLEANIVKKIVLFVLSVPIALFSNFIRVVILCFAAYIYGDKAISGFFHDFTGYMVFIIAFACLRFCYGLLGKGKG